MFVRPRRGARSASGDPAAARTSQHEHIGISAKRMILAKASPLKLDSIASVTIALSGAFWGLWWIPLRQIEHQGLSGNWASLVLYGAGALVLLPVVLLRPRLAASDLWRLLVIGILSGVGFALWNNALIYGAVVRVTLLFYLSPVWASLFGVLLLGDKLGVLRLLSILLGLAGASMVLNFEGALPVPRDLAEWSGLASGIAFALLAVYVRKSQDVGALEKTFANQLFAIPFAGLFLLLLPAPAPSFDALFSALPVILLSCVWLVPVMFLILWGAGRLDPGRVSILLLFEVVASATSAAILTDEPFGWREATGCILILGAGLVEGLNGLAAKTGSPTTSATR
jgi:drug/metabolite transporter (DMT)-like permease